MSEAERADRRETGRPVSLDDLRELTGAATPHFAQQIRNRVAKLIAPLPAEDPVRRFGESEIARLTELGRTGEHRGRSTHPDQPPLPSAAG
ncbi:hypothetical protein SK069_15620 [Patulibacter brassicae]|jgi:hypothetical protein|uniref:DUF3263 domain-containing protein n=1 Tax=Patulibacter brassicae TaxID=1705717 RepID=A0ABU4VMH3_9ACTN|nr:hypothetical protein [Patulibacter brassicae]MDX8153028.1 hypothetical protein [Patulibacter brassicae]